MSRRPAARTVTLHWTTLHWTTLHRTTLHWTTLLGVISLACLAVLVATGVVLMFFFDPSSDTVRYGGSDPLLRGVPISKAYASTLHVSLEVRGGLLVRQERSVPRDRLRSVDLTVDVVHRLAGLAVVAIGTGRQGGESDDDLKLQSVSTAEAERLRSVLLARGPARTADAGAGNDGIVSALAILGDEATKAGNGSVTVTVQKAPPKG